MNMPVMSGAELIETVASRWPRIKSIGLSSYDDYDYLRQSIKAGPLITCSSISWTHNPCWPP